jgi:hypothetical protein
MSLYTAFTESAVIPGGAHPNADQNRPHELALTHFKKPPAKGIRVLWTKNYYSLRDR